MRMKPKKKKQSKKAYQVTPFMLSMPFNKKKKQNEFEYKCDLCGKESNFDGTVWYSDNPEPTSLCRSCYMKWNRENKQYYDSHKHIKPCTKEWEKNCKKQERLFNKWFKEELKSHETKEEKAEGGQKHESRQEREHNQL